MKFRCPYCRDVLGQELAPICPNCKKAVKIPQHLKESVDKITKIKKEDSEARRAGNRILVAPTFLDFSSPVIPLVAIMMTFGGILIYSLRDRSEVPPVTWPDSPEMVIEKAKARSLAVATEEVYVIRLALEIFKRDVGRYPETTEGLMALLNNPKKGEIAWSGPYLMMLRPDPWKNRYVYSSENGTMKIFSSGPDGIPNTPDDIIPPEPTPQDREDYDL